MLSKFFRLVVLIFILSPGIGISSTVLPPEIQIDVVNADDGFTTFKVNVNKNGYEFLGGLTEYISTAELDAYFGVISPGRKELWTWSKYKGKTILQKGFFPIEKKITKDTPQSYITNYLFLGNEPRGMYLLFLLFVGNDKDPEDISNWAYIDVRPFFF